MLYNLRIRIELNILMKITLDVTQAVMLGGLVISAEILLVSAVFLRRI